MHNYALGFSLFLRNWIVFVIPRRKHCVNVVHPSDFFLFKIWPWFYISYVRISGLTEPFVKAWKWHLILLTPQWKERKIRASHKALLKIDYSSYGVHSALSMNQKKFQKHEKYYHSIKAGTLGGHNPPCLKSYKIRYSIKHFENQKFTCFTRLVLNGIIHIDKASWVDSNFLANFLWAK